MIYKNFKDYKLSNLGFGSMRLPMDGIKIDEKKSDEIIDTAINCGINYFDTAYVYLNQQAESYLGKVLNKYQRDKWALATKFPGHTVRKSFNPEEIFEEQIKNCNVEYFDFYLLHNVYEKSYNVYTDEQWKIIDYLVKQKELGRIKHLGFSTHGLVPFMEKFLNEFGDIMEFCQIQLNYLDWTLQNAKAKVQLLKERNIPIWVMEPLRGGKLVNLPEKALNEMKKVQPNWTGVEWGYRFLQSLDVDMILTGFGTVEQVKENVAYFEEKKDFGSKELTVALKVADKLKNEIPCTKCGYCKPGCPKGLDIPLLINQWNDMRFNPTYTVSMFMDSIPPEKQPSACIKCGKCKNICPQFIDIPSELSAFAEKQASIPSWADVCKEREKNSIKIKQNN